MAIKSEKKAKLTLTINKQVNFHDGETDYEGVIRSVDHDLNSIEILLSNGQVIDVPFQFINAI